MDGASVGDMDVADGLLSLEKGAQAVHDVVVAQAANHRAGTASTLSKSEVAGTGAKPWRQKGTGRARAGYRQSPIWRGGAVAFGPKPRDYGKKINKKVAKLAFRRAFSERVDAGQIKVLEKLEIAEPKTRLVAALMKALEIPGAALLVVDEVTPNIALAARNLPRVELARASDVNVSQLMRYPQIIVTKAAMDRITGRLGGSTEGAS
jgi:large subunit ribosomal protein L4